MIKRPNKKYNFPNAGSRRLPFKGVALSLLASSLAACGGGSSSSSGDAGSSISSTVPNSSLMASSNSLATSSSVTVASSVAAMSSSSVANPPSSAAAGAPVADVSGTGPIVALATTEIIFKSDRSTDADGVIAGVVWDFGDGNQSTAINPRHTYAAPGTYNVQLTVSDNDGLTDTAIVPITLLDTVGEGVAPTAQITVSVERGEVPLAVTFDGSDSNASGNIVSYEWDFGGGNYAYGPTVDHVFHDALTHQVFLTVTDDKGLSHEAHAEVNAILAVPKGTPGEALQTQGNPFADSAFYVSPDIETLQNQSLEKVDPVADEQLYKDIKFVQQMPSAVWLDRTIAIYGGSENGGRRPLSKDYATPGNTFLGHFDEAVAQQQALADSQGNLPPMTVVIIVYNLPDRDCAALASNGLLNETNDADGDGMPDGTGMQIYKEDYIDVIAEIFSKYPTLRIVAMLEPDGFPNMITNVGKMFPKCDAVSAAKVYEKALQYAIGKFAPMENVYTYMDIGHSGWLGWADNLSGAVTGFTRLVAGATDSGRLDVIKGFASNTSGYTPLREPYISNAFEDRMALASFYEWNQQVDELSFIDTLYDAFTAKGFPDDVGFIIDTARNGWGGPNRPTGEGAPGSKDDPNYRIDLRAHRGHWCNINEAGIGEIPQANPDASRPYLDAYYWMKPPGESDGISTPTDGVNDEGKSYDPMCGGESSNSTGVTADVLQNAPHAGSWFHEQFIMLIENAFPPLGSKAPDASTGGAKPSIVEDFDDYAVGAEPNNVWDTVKDGEATIAVSDEMFYGLRGKSLKMTASEETQHNDAIAMLSLTSDQLGGAASHMFGRARVYIEDNGPEVDMKWTMVTATGNRGQDRDVQYRFGGADGNFAAALDSNGRGASCDLASSMAIPKGAWACLEWEMNPANGELNFWLDGEQINDLAIRGDASGCASRSWADGPSSFLEVNLGIGRYKPSGQQPQGQPEKPAKPDVAMYVDDIALSSGRLGCGKVRK